jgi:hypothetical protein
MSWFRKKQLSAPQLAKMLHNIFVCEEYTPLALDKFAVPEAAVEAFKQRILLYREALVYLALIERRSANPCVAQVLSSYEALIFGDGHKLVTSGRRNSIFEATKELAQLFKPLAQDPDLSWARHWIAQTGYDETNPITLYLFLTNWIGLFLAARESIGNLVLNERNSN